jgi:hypothetical protein
MAADPHDAPAFYNAVTFTVAVTYTVEGGARFGTADRRARRVAERLANHAARTAGAVEVTAVPGPSHVTLLLPPRRGIWPNARAGARRLAASQLLGSARSCIRRAA